MQNNLRKWLSLMISIILYYVIHEGTHVIVALYYGVFQKIRILGLGIQVVTKIEALSSFQKAIFCVSGSISTLIVGYFLVLLTKKILKINSKLFKAICYYATIVLLLLDPIYLTVLYKYVGGGDMNGIILFGLKEFSIQLLSFIILILNITIIIKQIYPLYKENFSKE